MPEIDVSVAKRQPNPYARRIEKSGIELREGRGRPRRGEETGPTATKSVRLPPAVWARLEKLARAEGITVHALLRRAIIQLANRAA